MIADGARPRPVTAGFGRLLMFGLVFFLLQATYESLRGTWLDTVIIEWLTVAPSAALANVIAPEVGVHADGTRIVAPTERLNILPGCEGAEAFLLLLSGMLCARRAWRITLIGVGLGLLVVYVANVLRIVALFFAALRDRPLFSLVHAYLSPIIIVGIGVLFFALWLAWSDPDGTAA